MLRNGEESFCPNKLWVIQGRLVKTGFEEQLGLVAHDWSLLYGLVTAAIAIFFGWLANVIFRRD